MGIFLFAIGLLWAGIGICNIYFGISKMPISAWTSTWVSINLMVNVPVFVLPGFVVAAVGHYFHNKKAPDRAPEKKCPQCAEKIKKEAKICRFCGFKFEA